jgi:hypothetical protein
MVRVGQAAVALVVAAGACTSTSGGPRGSATVQLNNMPDGVATISYDAATQTPSLTLDGFGFAPDRQYVAHLHPGGCLNRSAADLASFGPVTASPTGALGGTFKGSAQLVAGVPAGGRIDIHEGTAAPDSATAAACSDLGADTSAAVRIYPRPDEKPFGTARLAHTSGALTIMLDLSAVKRLTRHAVEVGRGSCRATGQALHSFDVGADQSGRINVTHKVAHPGTVPSGDWYIAVRETTSHTSRMLLCAPIGPLKPS